MRLSLHVKTGWIVVVFLIVAVWPIAPSWGGLGIETDPIPTKTATFAGGRFWAMEEVFERQKGIADVISGYTGGQDKDPTYDKVASGKTGHVEAVHITYYPSQISYQEILSLFWHNIDPTEEEGQFCDAGSQYKAAIFYHDEEQKQLAESSKAELEKTKPFSGEIVTPILIFSIFYKAEQVHQNYAIGNPIRYRLYKWKCGRVERLKSLWGK